MESFDSVNFNNYSRAPFPTSAFLTYLIASFCCFVIYLVAFLKVFKNENPQKRCCDLMRYGPTTLLVLGMPILADGVHLIDSTVGTIGYFKGQDLPSHFGIEIVVGFVVISNLAVVNYFQLKIAGMAAIERCTTLDKEMETLRRVKIANWIYLPFYILLTCIQYITEFLYLWSFNSVNLRNKGAYMGLILTFNGLKFLLTLALCLASLRFSR